MLVTIIRAEKEADFNPSRVWWFHQGEGKSLGGQAEIKCACLSANSFTGKRNFTHMGNEIDTGCSVRFTTLFANKTIHKISAMKVSGEKAAPWSSPTVPEGNSRARHILRDSARLERCSRCFPYSVVYEYLKVINVKLSVQWCSLHVKVLEKALLKMKLIPISKCLYSFYFEDEKMSFNTVGILWLLSPKF